MDAFALLSRTEGIIPAIESAHAVAGALQLAEEQPGSTILVNLSGRGDKDMGTAIEWFGLGVPRPGADDEAGVPAGTPGEGSGNHADASPRDEHASRPSRRPGRRVVPRWSATCRPASPTSPARSRP